MPDAVEFIKTVKRTAVDAVKAEKPAEIFFGKVISINPLNVLVDQKLNLGEKQLMLTRNVSDFKTGITVGNIQNHYASEIFSGADSMPAASSYDYSAGKIEITVHNGLDVGDVVVLIRQQGGQKYIVWDRIL